VKEALAFKGHQMIEKYMPFIRVNNELDKRRVDGALTISEASGIKDIYYSDSHITYQNVVISLTGNNYKIDSISDLSGRNVLVFADAAIYIGTEYAEMAENNPDYNELNQQENQVAMLFKGRADVLVCDINIFKYYRQNNT